MANSVKGVPVSGRTWKSEQTVRATARTASKTLRPGWTKQQERRKQQKIVKALESEIKETKEQERALIASKAKERRLAQEEKEKKAEIVTKVSAAKLKRMSKKQVKRLGRVVTA